MASKQREIISDKIWEVQTLCSSVKEESVLQKEPLYKKFKAKYEVFENVKQAKRKNRIE